MTTLNPLFGMKLNATKLVQHLITPYAGDCLIRVFCIKQTNRQSPNGTAYNYNIIGTIQMKRIGMAQKNRHLTIKFMECHHKKTKI